MMPYVVKQGDHLAKLAFRYGFSATEVWDHPKNADLKARRVKSSVLYPGDLLFLPSARRKRIPVMMGTTNRYQARVPQEPLRLHFDDRRLWDASYTLTGAGVEREGQTDGSGWLHELVAVHVREVTVVFPATAIQYRVRIGDLNPIDEASGVRQRLIHRGYRRPLPGESPQQSQRADRAALIKFQADHGLSETGVVDSDTMAQLQNVHHS